MIWYVYILELKNWKYYIGSTNNLERRFTEHQRWSTASTKNNRPLKLLYSKTFISREDAHKKELWLKKQKSKKVIQKFMAL
jgi:putative endonuclease